MTAPIAALMRWTRRPVATSDGHADRGSVTPLVIGMLVCLLLLTAGVTAAGSAFLAGQRLQRLCDGAVAAAVGAVNPKRTTSEGVGLSDPIAAANEYLRVRGPDVGAVLNLGADTVTAQCSNEAPITFGALFGSPTLARTVTSTSEPIYKQSALGSAPDSVRGPRRDLDMNRPNVRLRVAAVAIATLLFVAACTSSSADGPTSTPVTPNPSASVIDTASGSPSPTVSSSTSAASPTPSVIDVPTPTPTSAPLDPAAQEAADRAAVEAQWVAFWNVYLGIVRIPSDQRAAELAAVAIPPVSDQILQAASQADVDGVDNYGPVTHRLFWQFAINGASSATVADCLDQSQTGTVNKTSGEVLTTGAPRNNTRGQFTRGEDGIWRLSQIFFLEEAC